MRSILPGSALCLADIDPIGGSINGASKASSIDKGFEHNHRMLISFLPVVSDLPDNESQDVTGQTFDLDPGQYEKSGVVCQEPEIPLPGIVIPLDEFVSGSDFPCGRGKEQTAQGALPSIED